MGQSGLSVHDWRTHVIVIGSGVAGLSCALALAPKPVTVITKTAVAGSGSSVWAQGGIAAALGDGDTPESHADDTVAAGAGLTDPDVALLLARDGATAVRHLIDTGAPVDRTPAGRVAFGREAAHSAARIVHAGGDASGRTLVADLLRRVAATPSINLVTDLFALDLLASKGRVTGVLGWHREHGPVQIHANAVVIASGGIGSLWRETTNPQEATGDGLALAARAGAVLSDIEFVQFHPTALIPKERSQGEPLPLLTEALRGAGARLLDSRGTLFMADEHPLAELAPRDIVARAIARRTAGGSPVYLDLRQVLASTGEKSFPQAILGCRKAGFDPFSEPVPIMPAAHYHMGGVATDHDGRSTIDGLWVCGESACTGVHGANRLASNSLLEGLVFGRRVAADILAGGSSGGIVTEVRDCRLPPATVALAPCLFLRSGLRRIMAEAVGITRTCAGLAEAATALRALESEFRALETSVRTGAEGFDAIVAWGELRNMLTVARMIVLAASRRHESRGAHFLADHPQPDDKAAVRQRLTLDDLAGADRLDGAATVLSAS